MKTKPESYSPIESTGEILSIDQREQDACRHIVHKLVRIEQELWTLGEPKAARHCADAIDAMKNHPNPYRRRVGHE